MTIRVLVTGGTGSFGKTIVRRLLSYKDQEIVVFSRDEQKHVAMRRDLSKEDSEKVRFIVGDVRDKPRVKEAIRGCARVFHAAAIKHVHFTEMHPTEAFKTNVLGAQNVIEAAYEEGVDRLVAISTDKAVQPVNAMGMTKALQERLVTSFAVKNQVRYCCVRYGNVFDSNGSVLPFFKQIVLKAAVDKSDVVLPVTHKNMTRFVLSLEQAIDLVEVAVENAAYGQIFVKESPSFFVEDLATAMLAAFRIPQDRFKIEHIGIRPGEKMHEILVSSEEWRRTLRIVKSFGKRLVVFYQINPYKSEDDLYEEVVGEYSSESAQKMTVDALARLIEENEKGLSLSDLL